MKAYLLFLMLLFTSLYVNAQEPSFSEEWTTYTNNNSNVGSDINTGIVVDNKNNVYIIKGTNPMNQTISLGSLSKFSPDGVLLWTTASFGKTFGLAIDHNKDIIIAGYTNREEGIATNGVFQENYGGGIGDDAFLMKFDEHGNKIWGTYFGGAGSEKSHTSAETHYIGLDVDAENNIFWTFGTQSDDMATANTFQEQRNGANYLISKFNPQGQRIWSTYYGTDQVQVHSISGLQVDESGVYIAGYVYNKDIANSYFDTGGNYVFQAQTHSIFISKFDLTGNRIWSYYIPQGDGQNFSRRNALLLTNNNLYLTYGTSSTNIGTSDTSFPNMYDPNSSGSGVLARLDIEGSLLWTTYLPGTDYPLPLIGTSMATNDGSDIYIMAKKLADGNDMLDGYLSDMENSDTYYIIKFDENGQFVFGNYLGKSSNEVRGVYGMNLYNQGIYSYGGDEGSNNVATPGAFQDTPLEGKPNSFLSKYVDESFLDIKSYDNFAVAIYPNPTSSVLNFRLNELVDSSIKIEVYNIIGQLTKTKTTSETKGYIDIADLSSGVYLLKFQTEDGGKITTKKIIVK